MKCAVYARKNINDDSNTKYTSVTRQAQRGLMIILTIVPLISIAAPNKVQYELSEKCGKRAAEIFTQEYGTLASANDFYENHYNSNLNKCFILITEKTQGEKASQSISTILLMDVNELKIYGEIVQSDIGHISMCFIQGHVCHTRHEWNSLLKPFMED